MFFDFGDFRQYEWSLDWFFEKKNLTRLKAWIEGFVRHRVFFDTGVVCQRSFNNTGGKGYASVAHVHRQWFMLNRSGILGRTPVSGHPQNARIQIHETRRLHNKSRPLTSTPVLYNGFILETFASKGVGVIGY